MTTERDEHSTSGQCGIPGCKRSADGLLCDEHRAPPERLEARTRRCSAIEPDGQQCQTFTLHARCYRHRRQRGGDERL